MGKRGGWEREERTKQYETLRDDPDPSNRSYLIHLNSHFPFFFVSQKVCTFLFLCAHTRVSMCVGECMYVCISFVTRRMFQFWF